MNWQPAIERLNQTVVGRFDSQPLDSERIQFWMDYREPLPPVLVCEDGFIVDGRHRVQAVRNRNEFVWGNTVDRLGEHWVATGNVVRVT